jgi:hypothetical protein
LLGLQVVYEVGGVQKTGALNMLADVSLAEARECTLEAGDFVRSVDCLRGKDGRVVGVSMVSQSNVVLRGGAMSESRQAIEMKPREYPVCLYGCLLPDGVEMLGVEFVGEE